MLWTPAADERHHEDVRLNTAACGEDDIGWREEGVSDTLVLEILGEDDVKLRDSLLVPECRRRRHE